jgi:hypothetical protein
MLHKVHGHPALQVPEAQDSRPAGAIVVATSTAEAYRCEQEGMALTTTDVATADFAQIRC